MAKAETKNTTRRANEAASGKALMRRAQKRRRAKTEKRAYFAAKRSNSAVRVRLKATHKKDGFTSFEGSHVIK